MRLFAAFLLGVSAVQTPAQSSATAAVEARQAEVVQVGRQIYRINLGDPGWTHTVVPICPAFRHHVFARYDRMAHGKQESYLAVFPLDVPGAPPTDKPWRGGIVLVNLHSDQTPLAERASTILTFNHIWSYEFTHSGQFEAFPGLSWSGFAQCYARFAGEAPDTVDVAEPEESIDMKSLHPQRIRLPLQHTGRQSRSMNIELEPDGLLKQVAITQTPLDIEGQ
jgi:hypothetical protein